MGRAERNQVTTQPRGETTGAPSPPVGGKEGVLETMLFYLGSEDENQFTGQRRHVRGSEAVCLRWGKQNLCKGLVLRGCTMASR